MEQREADAAVGRFRFSLPPNRSRDLPNALLERDVDGAVSGWGLIALIEAVLEPELYRIHPQPLGD